MGTISARSTDKSIAPPFIEPSYEFRAKFDKASFTFRHTLANHPAFTLERLLQLAKDTEATRPKDLHYDSGVTNIDQRWDKTPKPQFTIADAIQRIEHCGAWIVLKNANKDPEYGAILRECMQELQDLTGLNLGRVMKVQEVILFITSPNRVTTYHIDRECSLLLQIQGSKEISIFDRNDREVLSEEEIERFWSVDHNAPRYRAEVQNRATVYELNPGTAVHIPVNCPHWVQNRDNISISLNMNYQYRDAARANIYRMNFLLRRVGIRPSAPGKSPVKDKVKSLTIAPAVWAKNTLSRKKQSHSD